MRCLIVVCGLVVIAGLTSGSAIPMWEFLSRGEKMTYLFNMFVKQVQKRCDSDPMPDCTKVLMVYGVTNLAKMDDDSLDKMDPYQRGAQDIIWDSMMKGGFRSDAGAAPSSRTDPDEFYSSAVDGLESDVQEGGNAVGPQGASTAADEELVPPPVSQQQPARFVIGPMVVRVLPDGSPVPGDAQRPLPRDEDAEEIRAMRRRPIPSLEQFQRPNQQRAQMDARLRGGASVPQGQQSRDRSYPDMGSGRLESILAPEQARLSYPQASASQPHSTFVLPPPGVNLRTVAP